MTEPTDEQVEKLAELLGAKSLLTGTLTVTGPDGAAVSDESISEPDESVTTNSEG